MTLNRALTLADRDDAALLRSLEREAGIAMPVVHHRLPSGRIACGLTARWTRHDGGDGSATCRNCLRIMEQGASR